MYIDKTNSPPPPATKPGFKTPAGSCDCHCHVFGPYDQFPLAADRTYGPPESPVDTYLAMLDTIGMDYGVLVQASAHGMDNSAMLNAISKHPDRLRGVAVVRGTITKPELVELYKKGVRGLRFSRLFNADGSRKYKNAVDVSEMIDLLPTLKELGMHVQLWIGMEQIPELEPIIRSAGIPLVIDHISRLEATVGVENENFKRLCQLVKEGYLWVKVTPYRCSTLYPDYPDVRPFHEKLVQANPDRLLWGSDWPHINMSKDIPDPGHLVDLLAQWTPDQEVLKKILVTNPAKLYGF